MNQFPDIERIRSNKIDLVSFVILIIIISIPVAIVRAMVKDEPVQPVVQVEVVKPVIESPAPPSVEDPSLLNDVYNDEEIVEMQNDAIAVKPDVNANSKALDEAIPLASIKYGVDMRLLTGIAIAESSYGAKCFRNNCFGITMPGTYGQLESYPTIAEGVFDAAYNLKTNYNDVGLITPEEIAKKYLGHSQTETWLNNVRSAYGQK